MKALNKQELFEWIKANPETVAAAVRECYRPYNYTAVYFADSKTPKVGNIQTGWSPSHPYIPISPEATTAAGVLEDIKTII